MSKIIRIAMTIVWTYVAVTAIQGLLMLVYRTVILIKNRKK